MTGGAGAGTSVPRPVLTRMTGLPVLLLCLLGMTLVTSGFPQARLPQQHRSGSPLVGPRGESKPDQWEVLYPSISLRDWSVQMMSIPDFGAAKSKAEMLGEAWLPETQSQLAAALTEGWPGDWSSDQEPSEEKRNIAVGDDAAFREKNKLLTAMQRQKWLNSYIHKLLVVSQ